MTWQADLVNRISRETKAVALGDVLAELITARNALLVKLDADTQVGDTNYAELLWLDTLVANPYIPADTTRPTVTAAAVNAAGTTLTLTFSESLIRSHGGSYAGFTLTGSVSSSRAISNPVRTNNTLTFTCARVIAGETVTVGYTGTDLRDIAGNQLNTIISGEVTNNSTWDGTAPTLTSATVNAAGTTLTLLFGEVIESVSGNYTGFALADSIRGSLALSAPSLNQAGTTLTFTCAKAYSGETLTISYTGTDITDSNANDLAAITDHSVTNNSTQSQ